VTHNVNYFTEETGKKSQISKREKKMSKRGSFFFPFRVWVGLGVEKKEAKEGRGMGRDTADGKEEINEQNLLLCCSAGLRILTRHKGTMRPVPDKRHE
jgi:hypothetical protein